MVAVVRIIQRAPPFRLIYNGEVLTSRMDRCDSELYDSCVSVERVKPFAKPHPDAD